MNNKTFKFKQIKKFGDNMTKDNKKRKMYENMQLLKDENGKEYLSYSSLVGNVKDFSPWTIADYKKNMGFDDMTKIINVGYSYALVKENEIKDIPYHEIEKVYYEGKLYDVVVASTYEASRLFDEIMDTKEEFSKDKLQRYSEIDKSMNMDKEKQEDIIMENNEKDVTINEEKEYISVNLPKFAIENATFKSKVNPDKEYARVKVPNENGEFGYPMAKFNVQTSRIKEDKFHPDTRVFISFDKESEIICYKTKIVDGAFVNDGKDVLSPEELKNRYALNYEKYKEKNIANDNEIDDDKIEKEREQF